MNCQQSAWGHIKQRALYLLLCLQQKLFRDQASKQRMHLLTKHINNDRTKRNSINPTNMFFSLIEIFRGPSHVPPMYTTCHWKRSP